MSRLLSEINFFENGEQVRSILADAGIFTDENIVKMGCTGLCYELRMRKPSAAADALVRAAFVRQNMGGSACGLPCYVPPTRFCLVHNTIGGLQEGQAGFAPEAVAYCSRELTPGEKLHVGAVAAAIEQTGAREARTRFGMEPDEDCAGAAGALDPDFRCPEHPRDEPNWKCRFCLAASIIHGPLEPRVEVGLLGENGDQDMAFFTPEYLADLLSSSRNPMRHGEPREIHLRVVVACWSRANFARSW